MTVDLFKDLMPSLMIHKKEVFESDKDKDEFFRNKSFIVNRVLSMYMDCVIPANEMNKFHQLDGKLKFDFFINILRGYKRPYNYAKIRKYSDLEIIKEYYGVGDLRAKEYHDMLSSQQLQEIKKRIDKGGALSGSSTVE